MPTKWFSGRSSRGHLITSVVWAGPTRTPLILYSWCCWWDSSEVSVDATRLWPQLAKRWRLSAIFTIAAYKYRNNCHTFCQMDPTAHLNGKGCGFVGLWPMSMVPVSTSWTTSVMAGQLVVCLLKAWIIKIKRG